MWDYKTVFATNWFVAICEAIKCFLQTALNQHAGLQSGFCYKLVCSDMQGYKVVFATNWFVAICKATKWFLLQTGL